MYTLHNDKQEEFVVELTVEGASYSKTKCRLVLENTSGINTIFYGDVNENGVAKIVIPKTKGVLQEGTQGNAVLEVIADDTFFIPWNDSYEIKASKKVTAEVKSTGKPVIKEDKAVTLKKAPKKKKEGSPLSYIQEAFKKNNINKKTINTKEGLDKLTTVLAESIAKQKISKDYVNKNFDKILMTVIKS